MPIKQPSYLREMLFSNGNLYALLGSIAAAAVLSIPYGFGAGLVPLIGFAAGEAIAAMFIPFSERFRAKVDKAYRIQARETTRKHLLEEIAQRQQRDAHAWGNFGSHESYRRMQMRVASLYRIAQDRHTQLSLSDVEKLDDATLDYLCMWLAALVIEERARAVSLEDIEARLQMIEHDLHAARPGTDQMQLQKARNEYLSLITRHRRMLSRKMAIEALMLSMPDQMDEIYQTIVTAPTATDVDSKLADAIAKLGLEEDLEAELEGALRETVPDFSVRLEARPATQKKAAGKSHTQQIHKR